MGFGNSGLMTVVGEHWRRRRSAAACCLGLHAGACYLADKQQSLTFDLWNAVCCMIS